MKKALTPQELEARRIKAKKIIAKLKKLVPDTAMPLNYSNDWELLVAVELSAQCTDKKVNEVTEKLFKKYPTFADYLLADPKEFEKDIHATGFYRNKTKNILAAAKMLKDKFKSKMPNTMEEILTIPGVARKTANIVLGRAHGVVEGIVVDTHVRRLANKLGLTTESDPVKIERDLMKIIPRKEWLLFTHRLIIYGRKYCPARPHDHARCPLSNI